MTSPRAQAIPSAIALCLLLLSCDSVNEPEDADLDGDDDGGDGGSAEGLTVVTWNLENFPVAANTLERVAELVPELGADVIGVQEIADLTAFSSLVAALPDHDGLIADDPGADLLVGLIFREGRISVVEESTLFPDDWYAFPRPPLMARLSVLDGGGGTAFDAIVVVVHLKAQLDAESVDRRRTACERLEEWIDGQLASGEETAVIVMGDWNDELTDGGSANVFSVFLDQPEHYAFLTMELARDGAFSYIPFESFLDHVLVTADALDAYGDGRIEVLELDRTVPNYTFSVSDHRPVRAYFEIP